MIDRNFTPHAFINYVTRKTLEWNPDDGEYQEYLLSWGIVACTTTNKTLDKATSQYSSQLLDVDGRTEAVEAWDEARLNQTLGAQKSAGASGASVGNGMNLQPISNFTAPPQPSVNDRGMVFHRGTENHKQATDTAMPTNTKYKEKQMAHLMAFCVEVGQGG